MLIFTDCNVRNNLLAVLNLVEAYAAGVIGSMDKCAHGSEFTSKGHLAVDREKTMETRCLFPFH